MLISTSCAVHAGAAAIRPIRPKAARAVSEHNAVNAVDVGDAPCVAHLAAASDQEISNEHQVSTPVGDAKTACSPDQQSSEPVRAETMDVNGNLAPLTDSNVVDVAEKEADNDREGREKRARISC